MRTVLLVEGVSDRVAVETLAARRGRDLGAEGVSVVPIGGAKNIGSFLERFGPKGLGREAGRASAMRARSVTSSAGSSGPASAPAYPATRWSGSGSSCASKTWRTS